MYRALGSVRGQWLPPLAAAPRRLTHSSAPILPRALRSFLSPSQTLNSSRRSQLGSWDELARVGRPEPVTVSPPRSWHRVAFARMRIGFELRPQLTCRPDYYRATKSPCLKTWLAVRSKQLIFFFRGGARSYRTRAKQRKSLCIYVASTSAKCYALTVTVFQEHTCCIEPLQIYVVQELKSISGSFVN